MSAPISPAGFVSPFADVDDLVAIGFDPPSKRAESRNMFTPKPHVWRDPSTIARREFLYGKHYVRKYVSATVAPGGVGKSSLALVEAVAMASGRRLLGVVPETPFKVWYVCLEDPREEIERRVAAILLHFGIKASEIEGRLFYDGRETEIILATQTKSGATVSEPVKDALIEALTEGEFDALVIDPFVSSHRVVENETGAIDAVVKTFGRIAGAANCAVELLHHTRKNGGAELTAEDARGAISFVDAARSIRVLNRMTRSEGEAAGVGNRNGFYFRADNGKANLAPPSTSATWFELVSVGLGNGSGGIVDDQDCLGVVTPWSWPDAFDGVETSDLRAVQAAISAGRWRENSQAANWAGKAVANALRLDPANKAHKAKISTLLRTWIKNGALVVVEGEDEKRMARKFVEAGELA